MSGDEMFVARRPPMLPDQHEATCAGCGSTALIPADEHELSTYTVCSGGGTCVYVVGGDGPSTSNTDTEEG